jgi:integrase
MSGPDWQAEDDPVSASAHLFVTAHGTLWSPEDAHKRFKRACVRAGLPAGLSFHGLRHDFASLLARLGVPLRVAMDMLGHSHELMTIYYQHAGDNDRRQAAGKVGDWLRQASGSA